MPISHQQYIDMLSRVNRNKLRDGPVPADAEPVERDLHDKILAECKARGWIAIHARMDRPTTTAVGTPDFVILADGGRLFLVECKSKTGKLTTAQLGFIAWSEKLGFPVQTIRSMSEFKALINA